MGLDWDISDSCGRTCLQLLSHPLFFSNSMMKMIQNPEGFSTVSSIYPGYRLNSLITTVRRTAYALNTAVIPTFLNLCRIESGAPNTNLSRIEFCFRF